MPRSVSASRRDGLGTLVAPPSWLRSCCLPPRSAIQAPLVVQSPLTIPSQRRARARHHSRDACDAHFQARAMTTSSAGLLATRGLDAWRDAGKALTEERRHGCRSDEAVQQERSRRRSDERLRGITLRAEAAR
jgi:hypothetical protein